MATDEQLNELIELAKKHLRAAIVTDMLEVLQGYRADNVSNDWLYEIVLGYLTRANRRSTLNN